MSILNQCQRGMRALRNRTSPYWNRLMDWAAGRELQERMDFAANADWAILEQHPARPRVFVWSVAGLLLFCLLWAGFAQIDEVARGEGKVVPSFQNQHIQSLDGGIVEHILVREGQMVKKGDLLLRIDSTRAQSSLRENQSQYLALTAKASRLKALSNGTELLIPDEVRAEAPEAARQETELYLSRRQELDATLGIARQQRAQRSQELNEARARRAQAEQSYLLSTKELEMTLPLKQSGAVSDVDVMRLQRDVSRSRGERDMAGAQIVRLQASINEASRRIQEVELAFRNNASNELSDTMARINGLSAGSVALYDRVKLTEVRAPVAGEIKRLYLNTVGSVVHPGKDILELVPAEDSLWLEARISPRDIAFLHPGQKAKLRFSAYDFTIYGAMEGEVLDIGADTIVDEKGQAYYIVKVRTDSAVLGGKKWRIIPGMVAQVDITTGKKSVLSYLLKPVLRAKAQALSER